MQKLNNELKKATVITLDKSGDLSWYAVSAPSLEDGKWNTYALCNDGTVLNADRQPIAHFMMVVISCLIASASDK